MTSLVSEQRGGASTQSRVRASALATRLEQGANALAQLASGLTTTQWFTALPHDGRAVGVVVHHVASVYPIEIEIAQLVAAGKAVTGVTADDIDAMNATHAAENASVEKDVAIALLRRNSAAAAAAIRNLTDEELDRAAAVSLYGDAPVSCQFVLEDHAVRHSFHHLARIRRLLQRS